MVSTNSQTGQSSSSPAGNMLSFGTPAGLGVDLGTPSNMNLGTPGTMGALAGVNMSLTLSDIGLGSGAGKRNEDEERRNKTREVLKRIGRPKGRVSEESIARISRRVGFDNNIDIPSYGGVYGNRKVSMAGNLIVVDMDFKDDLPQDVEVLFNSRNEAVAEHEKTAGKVLLEDVKLQQTKTASASAAAITSKLDRFAANLESLARIDRISSPHLNCFEAIAGIYSSLKKLYEMEKQAAVAVFPSDAVNVELKASREVLCTRSGRPTMHSRGRIGLTLDYWMQQRHLISDSKISRDNDAMDIDSGDGLERILDNGTDIFSLRIEAEPSSAELYPPLRVSDTWLPNSLELPPADSTEGIPWEDPPLTHLPSDMGGEGSTMAVDGDQKLPDMRFVAKLDPPIVMPWQVAVHTLQSVGLPEPQLLALPPAYHVLLLQDGTSSSGDMAGNNKPVATAEQYVLVNSGGAEFDARHVNSLYVPKPEFAYAYKLEELPFSHPRQLVEVLPTLRQWAYTGSLLVDAFVPSVTMSPHSSVSISQNRVVNSTKQLSLDDLLTPPATPEDTSEHILPVDTTLAVSALGAGLSFVFPTPSEEIPLAKITLQIGSNAHLTVTQPTQVPRGLSASPNNAVSTQTVEESMMCRALETCGDLGVWIEWMNRQDL